MTVGTIASVKKSPEKPNYTGLYCIRIAKSYAVPVKTFYAWISKEHLRAIMFCANFLDLHELTGKSIAFDESSKVVSFPTRNGLTLEIKCREIYS